MNLSEIPYDVWKHISEHLSLTDIIQLHRAFSIAFDEKIYDYLPLRDQKAWIGGIDFDYDYELCYECSISIKRNLEYTMSDEYDESEISRATRIYFSHTEIIFIRNVIEVCYANNFKIQKKNDEKESTNEEESTEDSERYCLYHNRGIPESFLDKAFELTVDEWSFFIGEKGLVYICSTCGEMCHSDYEEECLYASKYFEQRHLEYLQRQKDERKQEELKRKEEEERKRQEFLK